MKNVRSGVVVLWVLASAMGACRRSAPPQQIAPVPVVATGAMMPSMAPPMGMPVSLAYTVMPGIPTWSVSYSPDKMRDGNPSTYWCTPANPTFPVMGTITFPAPATVMSVNFNTALPGYATSGAREITLEALGPNGMPVAMVPAVLNQSTVTTVSFPAPTPAMALRLTIRSNYGGTYLGISEMQITGVGVAAPPVAAVPTAGAAIQFNLGQNPIAQINGALAQANQAMASAAAQANAAMASAASAIPTQVIPWTQGAQAFRGRTGQTVRVVCPPGGAPGSVWGSGIYTDDSSICTAAVHAGRIQMATGGSFGVQILPGMPAYQASSANGVTTQSYPQYSGSFSIVP